MSNTAYTGIPRPAPWQKVLAWLRGHKEDRRVLCVHSARGLNAEKDERNRSIDTANTEKDAISHAESPLPARYIENVSTCRSRESEGRSSTTRTKPGNHAAVTKRHARSGRVSLFSSHNPDVDSKISPTRTSPTTTCSTSYIPRNAASSHLRTTAPLYLYEE
ncbi:hypothetical protein QM012_005093 [Aureobasidium pullulans]|uniref:Uncharacterized protein n=1 Tax=Aureobasidium pullulans TaxID=5580 RepID=A0ABR0T5L3_AURPU